jgi:hypothetical protein
MSDKGKAEAIQILRQEVAYGCPVCRSPFLTWHHFDPPWHIEEHWRPEGMIAMWLECHPTADEKGDRPGDYSPAELRGMKRRGYDLESVQGGFISWQKKSILVRIGGTYTNLSGAGIVVNNEPQIMLRKNEADLLSLSFVLRNEQHEEVAIMTDNWFEAYPANIHDMIVRPKTRDVKIWLDKEDVGLELSFQRVTMDELSEILDADWKRSQDRVAKADEERRKTMPPNIREMQQAWRLFDPPAQNTTGKIVKEWARENCLADDGRIPFLQVERMAINYHGRRYDFKDGHMNLGTIQLGQSSAFGIFGALIQIVCSCPICRNPPQTGPFGSCQITPVI